ncbi:phosphatase, partial [Streptomyces rubiginosohelvolus]
MLDIGLLVRVHVDALIVAQNHMGVCDAIRRITPVGKLAAMSAPHLPKVAGIDPEVPVSTHTPAPLTEVPGPPGAFIQDRLAGWVSDLTTLHELTERLAATSTLDTALDELLQAGSALVGARRGLLVLEPANGEGPCATRGLGLSHAELGHLETVPRAATALGRVLDGLPDTADGVAAPDLLGEQDLDPRHREVATRLGYAASYALPLAAEAAGPAGPARRGAGEPAPPPPKLTPHTPPNPQYS